MNERAALALLADDVADAGDDAAVVDGQVLTTDMLHETTDFPDGTTRYTAGWRAVGASLSDVAAMGASATAAVAVYAAPEFDQTELEAFVSGASEVCETVGAEYVGGDLDESREFTAATTALGRTDDPVLRSGASPGEVVCVTGTLGRSAAALELFERGKTERANDLFRFEPRVAAGEGLADYATAMMDSSDGLARSLHQLAEASNCGFSVEWSEIPVDESVSAVSDTETEVRERALFFGEDFELVFTLAKSDLDAAREASPTPISVVGDVTECGRETQREGETESEAETDESVLLDGEPLPDSGYTHGQ